MENKKMLRPCAYLEWAYCEGKCGDCLHIKTSRHTVKYKDLIKELERAERVEKEVNKKQ